MTTKEEMKREAVERLEMLKVCENVIDDFKEDIINYSERQNKIFNANLHWTTDEMDKTIEEFEEKYKSLVYHCQLTHTLDGDMLSMLYVSSNVEEWEMDRADLKDGCAYANVVSTFGQEIGLIGVKSSMGGVLRTW